MTPRSLTRAFNQDKGDLDGSLHSLRHAFGSQLAIKGTPVKVLQELMWHARIATAYSTDTCHSFHVKPATQTAAKLPPEPLDVCHPAERSDALFTL